MRKGIGTGDGWIVTTTTAMIVTATAAMTITVTVVVTATRMIVIVPSSAAMERQNGRTDGGVVGPRNAAAAACATPPALPALQVQQALPAI